MSEYYKENIEWFTKEIADGIRDEQTIPNYMQEFPYRVDLVDQFQGHDEYGYDPVRSYKTLEEAVAVARRITEEAMLRIGSVSGWHGMGDAGLVYFNRDLVWDGIAEYTAKDGSAEVEKARRYATKAHEGQYRKGTNIPYIIHPIGVADILISHGCTNKLVIAALLHDTIEDTSITYDDLKREFGLYVAEIVGQLSEPDKSLSWKERKAHTVQRLKEVAPDVCLVSCADKLDNIRAIKRDLSESGDSLWKRFNATKEEQEGYYRSLASAFKERAPSGILKEIVSEFADTVDEVFVNSSK